MKFTIIGLETTNGGYAPGTNGVDKIAYLRTGYNKGFQFDGPVYLITYTGGDSETRKLIPAGHVTSIHVKKEEDNGEPSIESEVALP